MANRANSLNKADRTNRVKKAGKTNESYWACWDNKADSTNRLIRKRLISLICLV